MKYKHKITQITVQAQQFNNDTQLQLITENQLVFGQVKKDQYLVSYFNDKGEVINQIILDEDVFKNTYEPVKQLLLD
jgi:hypothetical protein